MHNTGFTECARADLCERGLYYLGMYLPPAYPSADQHPYRDQMSHEQRVSHAEKEPRSINQYPVTKQKLLGGTEQESGHNTSE